MSKQLHRLYPLPCDTCDLENLYLQHHGWYKKDRTESIVVANFVTSMDGRIAITTKDKGLHMPRSLTSKEDFRLFLELHAQADCLITHGGYLRSVNENVLGNILQLPTEFEDLYQWREQNGLNKYPDIVIASASLDFPIHPSLKNSKQNVLIATGIQADEQTVNEWRNQGFEVLLVGKSKYVEGKLLIEALSNKGYRHIYLIAGPKMMHTMVQDQQLSKFYLSNSHQLYAAEHYRSFIEGKFLNNTKLKLSSLYYDELSDNDCGQFFSSYECIYK